MLSERAQCSNSHRWKQAGEPQRPRLLHREGAFAKAAFAKTEEDSTAEKPREHSPPFWVPLRRPLSRCSSWQRNEMTETWLSLTGGLRGGKRRSARGSGAELFFVIRGAFGRGSDALGKRTSLAAKKATSALSSSCPRWISKASKTFPLVFLHARAFVAVRAESGTHAHRSNLSSTKRKDRARERERESERARDRPARSPLRLRRHFLFRLRRPKKPASQERPPRWCFLCRRRRSSVSQGAQR